MRPFWFTLLCCLLAVTAFASGGVDTQKPAQSIEELGQQLEKTLKDTHTPGLSIAIVHRDGPEWIAGLGQADVAANRPATPETLFRIGSTSKAFTSFSILKLESEGKLSLQDPVRKLAPEVWFDNPWEASNPVRVVDLLEHTTGWDDMHFREYAKDAPSMGLREALDYDHHSRVSRWPPGTRMAYCNSGPAVAAYIVEKVSGQRFEDYVAQNFFMPIGMKTATYFQPAPAIAATLYHPDGRTPYPYWHILFRPAGSINASANDMAAYLSFYLNRGTLNGNQVMPAASLDRAEIPTRTWAAQQGLRVGYGLSNYTTISEGFLYHGHNGAVDGGLTEFAYLPESGVGYFFSINSGNGYAYSEIGKIIRHYITRNLQKPQSPSVATLPESANAYAGWYQIDSPRTQMIYFIYRLSSMCHVRFESGKLVLTSLAGRKQFLPALGAQFRQSNEKRSDPVPTLMFFTPGAGQYMQLGGGTLTMKRIPASIAVSEIILTVWVLLAVIAVLLYAPFWLLGGLSRKRRRPVERAIRIWPLIAVISLLVMIAVVALSSADILVRLGNPSGWSITLFLSSLVFAAASLASALALWRAPRQEVRTWVRRHATAVTLGLLVLTAYLAYWGVIGLRTWA